MRLGDFESYERTRALSALGGDQLAENRGGGKSMSAKLTTIIGDYRNVVIPENSVIYCDPPYKDTKDYSVDFDHTAFYDWCERQTALVVISEYWMPEDRFVCVASRKRKSTFSATNNALEKVEKLFVPKHQYELYKKMMDNAAAD